MLQLQLHAVENCMVLYAVTQCKYLHIDDYLFYSKAFKKKSILINKVVLIPGLLFQQPWDKALPVIFTIKLLLEMYF